MITFQAEDWDEILHPSHLPFRLFVIWGPRTPKLNSTLYNTAVAAGVELKAGGMGRTGTEQGGFQAAAMFVTLAVSIIGGLTTG